MWPRVTITDVGVRGERRPLRASRDVFDDDFGGVRKPLAVRELLAIVDDVHAEADLVRQAGEVEADVAGADDVQLG